MNNVIWPITDALAAVPVPQDTPTATLNAMDIILSSSPIVMLVLLILASFSLITWAILFSKWKKLKRCSENSEIFLEVFWSGRSMEHIYTEAKKNVEAPVARVFQAGYKELQKLIEKERKKTGTESKDPVELGKFVPPESSIHNVERAVTMAQRNAVQELESSMTFLATTSSTAPFIGLFGTVWGIMSSFQNIGAQGGASLAVVAPGIAEALIATAVGLAAAIPATMGYNYFVHKLRTQRTQMENFSGDFLNIVRRNFLAG